MFGIEDRTKSTHFPNSEGLKNQLQIETPLSDANKSASTSKSKYCFNENTTWRYRKALNSTFTN